MEMAKGRPGSLGRYDKRRAGPEAKAVERSKRSSRGSPPAERPDWNGSPSTPIGTLARISGRSSSRNLIDAFMVFDVGGVRCGWLIGALIGRGGARRLRAGEMGGERGSCERMDSECVGEEGE
ncbi:hypothetical protein VPH35_122794 [Triticum aestivum]